MPVLCVTQARDLEKTLEMAAGDSPCVHIKQVTHNGSNDVSTWWVAAILIEFSNEKFHVCVALLHVALKAAGRDEDAGYRRNSVPVTGEARKQREQNDARSKQSSERHGSFDLKIQLQ